MASDSEAWLITENQDNALILRYKAASAAVDYIKQRSQASTVIGIGTGNTIEAFIDLFSQAAVSYAYCVASSQRSACALTKAGIRQQPLAHCHCVDIYLDGIDEGMQNGVTIKGGAGALAREKLLATMAGCFITVADQQRQVQQLGAFPLPVEVLPVAEQVVTHTLQLQGARVQKRENTLTDNGNSLLDVAGLAMQHPLNLETQLNNMPGVVENGIFARRKADAMIFSHAQGVDWIIINDRVI